MSGPRTPAPTAPRIYRLCSLGTVTAWRRPKESAGRRGCGFRWDPSRAASFPEALLCRFCPFYCIICVMGSGMLCFKKFFCSNTAEGAYHKRTVDGLRVCGTATAPLPSPPRRARAGSAPVAPTVPMRPACETVTGQSSAVRCVEEP